MHGISAEVFRIFVAGMCADGDFGLEGEVDGVTYGFLVAGMAAAGDVD